MIIKRRGHKESTELYKFTERTESKEAAESKSQGAESTERQSEYSTGETFHV